MSVQVQLRRGTTNQNNSFTGTIGEITYNITTGGIRTHNGSTLGGKELLLADLSNILGSIENASLANSTISGVALGDDLGELTIGDGLVLDTGTTYNGSTAVTLELDTTGVTAGTYGSALSVPVLDIDATGRVTGVTNVPITVSSGGEGSSITVSDNPPSTPSVGALWWDSSTATLRIFYNDGNSTQWVDASPQLAGPASTVPGPAGPAGPQGEIGPAGPAVAAGRQIALTMLFS